MSALGGGALIGAAAALLLLTHGRIAGISGVIGSLLPPVPSDRGWRLAFVAGLALAGALAALVAPSAVGASVRSSTAVVIGFLDVRGGWDPSLGLVMAGAIAVYAPLARWIQRARRTPWTDVAFHLPTRRDLDGKLAVGAMPGAAGGWLTRLAGR